MSRVPGASATPASVLTGNSSRRSRLFRLTSVLGSLTVLLTGIAVLGSDWPAGASTVTSVTSLTARPSSLTWVGGTVTLSAKVANARTCTFSVAPTTKGLPTTKPCTNGAVDERVNIRQNTGKKPTTYTFGLSVTGTTTVKAKATNITIGTEPPPTVSGLRATPSLLAWPGGTVTLSAQVTGAESCRFSSTPTITGMPSTVPCPDGTIADTVTVPANGTTKAEVLTFDLSVVGASTITAKAATVTISGAPPLRSP